MSLLGLILVIILVIFLTRRLQGPRSRRFLALTQCKILRRGRDSTRGMA